MADAFNLESLKRLKGLVLGSSQRQAGVMLSTGDIDAIGSNPGLPIGSLSLAVWPAANLGYLIPFRLHQNLVVRKMFIYNGSTASGNVSLAIYGEDFIQKVVLSAAHAGGSTIQELDIADITLVPGRYYMGISFDNNAAVVQGYSSPALYLRQLGVCQMVAAYPLPSTFVPAVMTQAFIPQVGISLRSLI
jgi:hypothetical protein